MARKKKQTELPVEVINGQQQGQLRALVERIERLLEDKAAITADLAEVYSEAKGTGFDTKILRKVIRLRAQDKTSREAEQTLIDLYLHAIEGDLFRRLEVVGDPPAAA